MTLSRSFLYSVELTMLKITIKKISKRKGFEIPSLSYELTLKKKPKLKLIIPLY